MVKGGYGAAPKPKAAPILRPSTAYHRAVDNREYTDEDKERRDEERQRQAEERRLAREAGQAVDLGAAGRYAERAAATNGKAPPAAPPSARPAPPSKASSAAPKASSGTKSWESWEPRSGSDPWQNGFDPWASNKAPAQAAARTITSSRYNGAANSETPADPWQTNDPWSSQQPAKASSQATNGRDYDYGTTSRQPAKASSQATNGRDYDYGTTTNGRDYDYGTRTHSWRNQSNGWNSGYDNSWKNGYEEADTPRLPDVPGVDREMLKEALGRGLADRHIPVLNLGRSQLTDEGLRVLVVFLIEQRIVVEDLRLGGCEQLRSPIAIIELMKDETCGIERGFSCLELSEGHIATEVFWRILEVCATGKGARPFVAAVWAANGRELGVYQRVVKTAQEYGLKAVVSDYDASALAPPLQQGAAQARQSVQLVVLVSASPPAPAAAPAAASRSSFLAPEAPAQAKAPPASAGLVPSTKAPPFLGTYQ